ncbi:MAG: hypothetical protein MjAS7_0960 [Metallosphaera javensis (ex Sakai et al. 2022)]|nr:MAG: hypothetical protein MjAS7_0960 [Metallosphaera javensis (ex Sakai et al. 2022)]
MSPGQVKAVLRSREIEYSPEVMDRVVKEIARRLMEFKSAPLPHDLFSLCGREVHQGQGERGGEGESSIRKLASTWTETSPSWTTR